MSNKFKAQLVKARRDLIIDAAIEVVAQQGFQRTTIKQIARQAEVADGTIYNYFKNKDAIMIGIMERLSEAEVRDIHFAEAELIPFDVFVTEYVAHRMNEVDEGYPLLKAILPEMLTNEELGDKIYEQLYEPSFAIAEQYFRFLIEQGSFSETLDTSTGKGTGEGTGSMDPGILSRMFASPLLGLLLLRLMGDKHINENWSLYTQAAVDMLLRAYGDMSKKATS